MLTRVWQAGVDTTDVANQSPPPTPLKSPHKDRVRHLDPIANLLSPIGGSDQPLRLKSP